MVLLFTALCYELGDDFFQADGALDVLGVWYGEVDPAGVEGFEHLDAVRSSGVPWATKLLTQVSRGTATVITSCLRTVAKAEAISLGVSRRGPPRRKALAIGRVLNSSSKLERCCGGGG